MKETLSTILAKKNWHQADRIPKGWEGLEIRKAQFYLPDFFTSSGNYETGIFYNCLSSTNYKGESYNYIEGVELFIKHIDSNIVMTMRHNGKNKYTFFPAWFQMFKSHNISSHQRTKAVEAINIPNSIGVFTEKKMFEWVKYCENYVSALNNALNEVENKNNDLEKEIESFIKSLQGDCKVERWAKYTIVQTSFFIVEFSIDKSCGYLSKKIQFNGNLKEIISITNKFLNHE